MQIKLTDPKVIQTAAKILQSGGVVAYPSETCYGLLANFHNKKAIKKIFQIKKRPEEKKLLILVQDYTAAQELITPTPLGKSLMQAHWPAPLTIIQPIKKPQPIEPTQPSEQLAPLTAQADAFAKIPAEFARPPDTLALRSPDHNFSQALLAACGFPLVSTSANLSGQDNPYTFQDIKNLKADLLIDGGDLPHTPPSTLIDATGTEIKILRQGELKI